MSSHKMFMAAIALVAPFAAGSAHGQVLVDGYPPLTQQMLDAVHESQDMLLHLRMKPQHRQAMRQLIVDSWRRGDQEMIQGVTQLAESFPQLRQLPERTRTLALRSNLLGFLDRLQRDAANGDPSSRIMWEAFTEVHAPIHPKAPTFVPVVADAYVDAYLFLGEVQSGKPAPALSPASRERLRKEMANDYVRMSEAQRKQMSEVMQRVTVYRIQWPGLGAAERLVVRADLGAKLTAEERQAVAQIRQMQSQHNMKMLSSQLNFMRQSTDTIMGSAPYWNPSANRWEQKGGIVTEFGVHRGQ